MRKKYFLFFIIIIAAGIGALVFYFYKTPQSNKSVTPQDNFIQNTLQAPAVSGNIVNSGISGRIVLESGAPFEASLDVFKSDNLTKPFISVRSDAQGRFQIPLRPATYVIKPSQVPRASLSDKYTVVVGDGRWVQIKIEYK